MHNRILTLSAVALGIAGVSVPAIAQTMGPTDTFRSGGDFRDRFNTDRIMKGSERAGATYSAMQSVAKCVVTSSDSMAGGLVGGPGTADGDYKKLETTINGKFRSCLSGRGKVSPMMASGAIAEELVHAGGMTAEDRARTVDVDKATRFHGEFAPGKISLDTIIRCLAVYSPGLAMKVFDQTTGTEKESAALDALYRATPECGLPAQPDDIAPPIQRASLANAVYLWNHFSG